MWTNIQVWWLGSQKFLIEIIGNSKTFEQDESHRKETGILWLLFIVRVVKSTKLRANKFNNPRSSSMERRFLIKSLLIYFDFLRERNINWLSPICALTRDGTCNLGMCPDGGSNPQSFGIRDNAPTDWATPARVIKSLFKRSCHLISLPDYLARISFSNLIPTNCDGKISPYFYRNRDANSHSGLRPTSHNSLIHKT